MLFNMPSTIATCHITDPANVFVNPQVVALLEYVPDLHLTTTEWCLLVSPPIGWQPLEAPGAAHRRKTSDLSVLMLGYAGQCLNFLFFVQYRRKREHLSRWRSIHSRCTSNLSLASIEHDWWPAASDQRLCHFNVWIAFPHLERCVRDNTLGGFSPWPPTRMLSLTTSLCDFWNFLFRYDIVISLRSLPF